MSPDEMVNPCDYYYAQRQMELHREYAKQRRKERRKKIQPAVCKECGYRHSTLTIKRGTFWTCVPCAVEAIEFHPLIVDHRKYCALQEKMLKKLDRAKSPELKSYICDLIYKEGLFVTRFERDYDGKVQIFVREELYETLIPLEVEIG